MVEAEQMQDSHNGLLRARGENNNFAPDRRQIAKGEKTAINRTGII